MRHSNSPQCPENELFSLSPDRVQRHQNQITSLMSFVFVFFLFTFVTQGLLVAPLENKFSPRWVLIIATLMVTLGIFLMLFATSFIHIAISLIVLTGKQLLIKLNL